MDPVRDRVRYVGKIGVVFGQRTELWIDHPVAASFEWKRVVWDIPRPRYERMRELVKELLGLGEFFNSLTRELSLGQKMRAELGLALLHEPELLFLDEPTIGLDVLAKRTILGFIKDLNREQRVTVMLTSHDMAELEQLAGRIVMIDHGKHRLRWAVRSAAARGVRPAPAAAGDRERHSRRRWAAPSWSKARPGGTSTSSTPRRPRSPRCWSRPPARRRCWMSRRTARRSTR